VYRCPKDGQKTRRTSFAINDFLLPVTSGGPDFSRIVALPEPSETMFMTECDDKYTGSDHFHFMPDDEGDYSPAGYKPQVAEDRHDGRANHLFVDSHVEARSWGTVKSELLRKGSRFINPAGHQ
jgi:prepilin-type processing-associated H-X9-DG protein